MNTYESYVSLEISKLLKDAGFDWHVKSCWDLSVDGDKWLNCDAIYPNNFRNNDEDIIYAPTLNVAQRWLREVKDEYVVIEIVAPGVYKVSILGRDCTSKSFKTYEEAQEAGIKKTLEIILEKGE